MVFNRIDRRFEVVHACMLVGEEDLDVTTCVKKRRELDHWPKVPTVWLSGWGGSPVDTKASLFLEDHIVDDRGI